MPKWIRKRISGHEVLIKKGSSEYRAITWHSSYKYADVILYKVPVADDYFYYYIEMVKEKDLKKTIEKYKKRFPKSKFFQRKKKHSITNKILES